MEAPNKYQNGKIYRIVDNAYTECYIGSTIQGLSSRMALHRREYRRYQDGKAPYVSSYALFDLYGVDNCKIELIEDYPCESKAQLAKREGYHIRHEECINKCVAGRTPTEYNEDNREHRKEYDKNYRETNKEKKKATDKAYYEANKEALIAKNKGYSTEKVECPVCGKTLTRGSIRRHTMTKHQA